MGGGGAERGDFNFCLLRGRGRHFVSGSSTSELRPSLPCVYYANLCPTVRSFKFGHTALARLVYRVWQLKL